MTVPAISGKKLGRLRPKPSHERKFHLPASRYFKRDLPPRPASTDYGSKAMGCLRQSLKNNDLGDCTAAGAFHIEGVFRGNSGTPVKFSDEQVIAFYSATTGYAGTEATDNGGDEVTVLDWWRENGLYISGAPIAKGAPAPSGTHKIAGHLAVDATNPEEIKNCLWLFGNIYGGFSLPQAWISPAPENDGFVWDAAGEPVDANGHAYCLYDYDDTDAPFKLCSWGLLGRNTEAALAKYGIASAGGELHVVISQDWLVKATQTAPNSMKWDELCADFQSRGGNIPAELQRLIA